MFFLRYISFVQHNFQRCIVYLIQQNRIISNRLNNDFTYSWFSTTYIPIWYAQKYPNTSELYKDGFT